MKRVLFVLLILVTIFAGCSRSPANQSGMKPEAVVDTFFKALSRGDVSTSLSLLADDVVIHSGTEIEGKAQAETAIRQSVTWHHQPSVVGPIKIEGEKVTLTIKESADEYEIMGLDYITADVEAKVHEGKIKAWTATVNPEDLKKITELTAGRIGIKYEPGYKQGMKVNEVAGNSPAYEAGIRQGDIIIAVNGISYSRMREGEMQLRIQGPVGTKVKLTITHEGASAHVDVEVTRVSPEELRW